MGKKRLIWASLLMLLLGIPAVVHARIHIPFFGHSRHKTTQAPSEMARTDTADSPYRSGWDAGYKRGYEGGQADHNNGAKFDADDAPGYKDGHSFCESLEGKGEHRCRTSYSEGFKQGYQDGYSGLVSRLMTTQEPAQSQAEAHPMETPNQAETPSQPEPPATAMQESPQPTDSEMTQSENQSNETTQAQNQPRALPKTASSVPLFGVIGLIGIALSLLSRVFRKIIKDNAA